MMRKFLIVLVLLSIQMTTAYHTAAAEVYQTPAVFVEETFAGEQPMAKAVWVTGDLKTRVKTVLGHPYRELRVRYWVLGERSAWILEEVGKVEPITLGVVVARGRIEAMKVLAYRESRGFEIRFPFFMDQYRGAQVDANTLRGRLPDAVLGRAQQERKGFREALAQLWSNSRWPEVRGQRPLASSADLGTRGAAGGCPGGVERLKSRASGRGAAW